MRKFSELKELVLGKLNMSLKEASDAGYLSKISRYANEGLMLIAEEFKPNVKKLIVEYTPKGNYQTPKGLRLNMPRDFLSFSDIPRTLTIGTDKIVNPRVDFFGDRGIILNRFGLYEIYYNTPYQSIPKNDDIMIEKDMDLTDSYTQEEIDNYTEDSAISLSVDDISGYTKYIEKFDGTIEKEASTNRYDSIKFFGIPQNVLNALPGYIASQLLRQDDIQLSTMLRNEFELTCSRLENNVFYTRLSYDGELF